MKFTIEVPTVFRKSSLRHSEDYEIATVTDNATLRDSKLSTAFKGSLKYFGIRHCTFNQTFVELTTYVFQPQDMSIENNVTLFQTCKMVVNDAKQMQVEKAVIIFASTRHVSQSSRIATNITAYIEATGMHDYSFDEFGGNGIDACKHFKDNLIKCKAEIINFDIEAYIGPILVLLVIAVIFAKFLFLIREIRSNRVQNIPGH